jgi:hypothetical protein
MSGVPTHPRVRTKAKDPVFWTDVIQLGKTVIAAVLAWIIATSVLDLPQSFLAPWSALLVVHATVYRTVSRGGQQVAATFLGVLLGWSAGALFGNGALGMGLMLAASFLLGRHRWLRQESATIATTGIVVLATYSADESHLLSSRLLDTTVGVVVGLAVNLVVWPPLRDRAAWAHAHRLPHELAGTLSEMASGLGPDLASSDVEGWIRRCRQVDVDIDEAWGLVRQAQESSRLNPRRSRPDDLEEIVTSLHLLEQAVAETLSLARTVATSADHANVWDDSFRSEWRRLLTTTASALDDGDPEPLAGVRDELSRLGAGLSTEGLSASVWQEYGGLLVNLRNIVDTADGLTRWTSGAGSTPRRRRRYDVHGSALRPHRRR